jgi:hypothetical protein
MRVFACFQNITYITRRCPQSIYEIIPQKIQIPTSYTTDFIDSQSIFNPQTMATSYRPQNKKMWITIIGRLDCYCLT